MNQTHTLMLVDNVALLFSIVFIIVYVVSHLLHALAYVVTSMVLALFRKHNNASSQNDIISIIFDIFTGILSSFAVYLINLIYVLYTVFINIFPLLIFAYALAALFRNSEITVQMVFESYNVFVKNNDWVMSIRNSIFILKTGLVMLVPIYNFFWYCLISGVRSIGMVLFSSDASHVLLVELGSSLGSVVKATVAAGNDWITRDYVGCRFASVIDDAVALAGTHPCLEYGPGLAQRGLHLSVWTDSLQDVGSAILQLAYTICPTIGTGFSVLLYPLFDNNLNGIIENLANFVVSAIWTFWDVSHLRCQAVLRSPRTSIRSRTALCVPDIAPFFRYLQAAAHAAGELVDNWANILQSSILTLFMDRDNEYMDECLADSYTLNTESLTSVFRGDNVVLRRVSPSLAAVTDGLDVVYADVSRAKLYNTSFEQRINLRYGLAPVHFIENIMQADGTGYTGTGLLGCSCHDENSVVNIQCRVALYSSVDSAFKQDIPAINTDITVVFENPNTARLLRTCSAIGVSVQAVRFPRRTVQQSPSGFYGAKPTFTGSVDCLSNPNGCSPVDAIIYVVPLCTNDAAVCVRGLKDNPCFPFCIGMHQRGKGNTPIVLYGQTQIASGVFLTNTDCSSVYNDVLSSIGTFQATTFLASPQSKDEETINVSVTSNTKIHSAPRRSCIITKNSSDKYTCQSNTACLGSRLIETVAQTDASSRASFAEFQPVVLAGDTVFFPQCIPFPDRDKMGHFDCDWTVDIHRISSDIQVCFFASVTL